MEGEKDLARAKDRVLKAEQQISAARSAGISGERQIAEGTSLMQRAEADYATTRGTASGRAPGQLDESITPSQAKCAESAGSLSRSYPKAGR